MMVLSGADTDQYLPALLRSYGMLSGPLLALVCCGCSGAPYVVPGAWLVPEEVHTWAPRMPNPPFCEPQRRPDLTR